VRGAARRQAEHRKQPKQYVDFHDHLVEAYTMSIQTINSRDYYGQGGVALLSVNDNTGVDPNK
jgi:hypothetical protein